MLDIKLRTGDKNDLDFVRDMLCEAFFWNPQIARPNLHEFSEKPEFQKLIADWGREGDCIIFAEIDDKPIGAAWHRLWTDSNHSYGFVDAVTPEIGIAVVADFRSKGVGRMLLQTLLNHARAADYPGLSLSVDPSNYARFLYESFGFAKVGESGTSWTYLLSL